MSKRPGRLPASLFRASARPVKLLIWVWGKGIFWDTQTLDEHLLEENCEDSQE